MGMIINPYRFGGGNDGFTKVLLHLDGADASTTITDVAAGVGTPATWAANGNAQIDIGAAQFGGASLLLDGTGDYVASADNANFNLGAGDWTIDCWVNRNSGTGRQLFCGQCDSSGGDASISFFIEYTAANVVRAVASNGTGIAVTSTTANTGALWRHIAFVRVGDILRLFIHGTQEGGDVAFTGTVVDSANALSVGRGGEIATLNFAGWIDEFRLSVGVARWTSNFTPPAEAYS